LKPIHIVGRFTVSHTHTHTHTHTHIYANSYCLQAYLCHDSVIYLTAVNSQDARPFETNKQELPIILLIKKNLSSDWTSPPPPQQNENYDHYTMHILCVIAEQL
jgi:hypothetical protein